MMASGSCSPCGACKFLRRKCSPECVFAPYFASDESPSIFAAIHRVFGASNVSKFLRLIPPPARSDAVSTMAYEAQARMRDPVYGCVAHVVALQQQVASLQAQVMQGRARLGLAVAPLRQEGNSRERETASHPSSFPGNKSASLMSSLDSANLSELRERYFMEDCSKERRPRKRLNVGEGGELRDLALWMMGD